METKNIYNLIILDESGSMSAIRKQAVSAMNETIQSIKVAGKENPQQRYFVSLVVFEGNGMKGVKTVRDRIPIEKTEEIADSEYNPCGCTPLHDAIGKSVTYLDGCITDKDMVLVTIITDGMENSSEEYNGASVKKLVERQREKGWTFAYIGANQDSVETASDMGIANALNWEATEEGIGEMEEKLCCCVSAFCNAAPDSSGDLDDLFSK